MAYDWLISDGDNIPMVAGAAISAGEWLMGKTGESTVIPATPTSDPIGIAAIDASITSGLARDAAVSVYAEGIVKTNVHADGADVEVGAALEIEDENTLVGLTSNPVIAIALEYVATGETDTIKVKIVHRG